MFPRFFWARLILILVVLTSQIKSFSQLDSISITNIIREAESLRQSDLIGADKLYKEAFGKSIRGNYDLGLFQSINGMGIISFYHGDYEAARLDFNTALSIAKIKNFEKEMGRAYFNTALTYYLTGDFKGAAKYYVEALRFASKVNDSIQILTLNQNLGVMYVDIEQYEKGLEYMEIAQKMAIRHKDTFKIGETTINLGRNLMKMELYDEATKIIDEVQPILESLKLPRFDYFANQILAEINTLNGRLKQGLLYAKKAEKYLIQFPSLQESMFLYNFMGEIYLELNEKDKAEEYIKKSLQLSKQMESKPIEMETSYNLAKLYHKKGNFKEVGPLYERYVELNDSIRSEENRKIVRELSEKYEAEQKDNEILKNQLALESSETKLQKSKAQNLIYGIIALLVAGLAFIFWYRARQRKKLSEQTIETLKREQELQAVAALIKGEDRERERIARDLHDSVNGSLAALKLQLESVPSNSLNQFDAKKLDTSMQLIDNTCERIRNISHNLAPPSLINSSLIEALESYCSKINDTGKIEVSFQHHGDAPKLPQKSEITLYHIAQELIQNSLKHSGGNKILVHLYCDDSEYHLTVEDNGSGYDVNKVKKGMGLNNIQSRVDFLSGSIEVISDQQGTSTTLIFHGEKALQI